MNRFSIALACLSVTGCASNLYITEFTKFENPNGAVILLARGKAIIQGREYIGRDCSNEVAYCVDYSGYFSIIAPRSCRDKFNSLPVGGFTRTPLGEDHHRSRSMYGVDRGEMVAYFYSWHGEGVVGLTFDSVHKIANYEELQAIGYRDPSFFYEKTSGPDFFPCHQQNKDTRSSP